MEFNPYNTLRVCFTILLVSQIKPFGFNPIFLRRSAGFFFSPYSNAYNKHGGVSDTSTHRRDFFECYNGLRSRKP